MNIKLISKLATVLFAGAAFSCCSFFTYADVHNYNVYSFDTFFEKEVENAKAAGSFGDGSLFKSVNSNALSVHGLNDDHNIDDDVNLMFEKVSNFLENSRNVSLQDFEKYCIDFMLKRDDGTFFDKIANLKASTFDELVKKGGWFDIVLFRGLEEKFAESLRKGEVYIGGRLSSNHLSQEGLGIDTTSNFNHAKFWAKIPSALNNGNIDSGKGEVVRLALKKGSKLIDSGYISKLFNLMVEKNSDYFKEFLDNKKIYGDFPFTNWFSNFKIEAEFVKEKTGFDFYDKVDELSSHERTKKFEEELNKIFSVSQNSTNNISEDRIKESQNFVKKQFQEFLDRHPDLKKFEKEFYVDKVYALSRNGGLLAKLMGYDVLYEEGAPMNLETVEDVDGKNFIADCVNVVNLDRLVVCSDCCEKFDRAVAREVII